MWSIDTRGGKMAAFQVHGKAFAAGLPYGELSSLLSAPNQTRCSGRAVAFAPLKFHDWESLGDSAKVRTVAPKTVLCAQNELPQCVYFIEDGLVKLTRISS